MSWNRKPTGRVNSAVGVRIVTNTGIWRCFTCRFDEDTFLELKKRAATRKVPVNVVIREIIEWGLNDYKP